jgi:hypothetical protein
MRPDQRCTRQAAPLYRDVESIGSEQPMPRKFRAANPAEFIAPKKRHVNILARK